MQNIVKIFFAGIELKLEKVTRLFRESILTILAIRCNNIP